MTIRKSLLVLRVVLTLALAVGSRSPAAAEINVITLLDGKELVGEVLNEEFKLQTPYALLTLKRAELASLLLDPSGQGMEGASLRNDDRVSGFVLTQKIDVRDRSGAILHLRKEKVKNVALALTSSAPSPGLHVLRFRNGDVLTGRLLDRKVVLATAYGTEELRSADIAELSVWGDLETKIRVTLLGGKQIEGRIQDEDLDVDLEYGSPLKIYVGNLQRVSALSQPHRGGGAEVLQARTRSTRGMVFVEGGEFLMGADDGEEDERPAKRVFVAPYFIDRTEVTNEQYGKFVNATGHKPPKHWKESSFLPGTGNLPVVGVSFQDASEYAIWAGKRLPSEEEWEKAARGADGRRYPWGDEYDAARANGEEAGLGHVSVAGKFSSGESPYGAMDMAGNVWEWTDSWYQVRKSKVFKGGSFRNTKEKLRSSYRSSFNPNLEADDLGFRCALSARGR